MAVDEIVGLGSGLPVSLYIVLQDPRAFEHGEP